jgi:hypothetical protein
MAIVKIYANFKEQQQVDPVQHEEAMNRICQICGRTLRDHTVDEAVECKTVRDGYREE